MSLIHYFSQTSSLPSSESVPSLTPQDLHDINKRVTSLSRQPKEAGLGLKRAKSTYSSYSAGDPARMGRCCQASWHFTVPESTARLLKQYLAELHNQRQTSVEIPDVTSLPTKVHGRPLLLGSTLDCEAKEYIVALWAAATASFEENHLCLASFDVFRGKQTLAFHECLAKNNILTCLLIALASCNPLIFQLASPLRRKWSNTSKPGMQSSFRNRLPVVLSFQMSKLTLVHPYWSLRAGS